MCRRVSFPRYTQRLVSLMRFIYIKDVRARKMRLMFDYKDYVLCVSDVSFALNLSLVLFLMNAFCAFVALSKECSLSLSLARAETSASRYAHARIFTSPSRTDVGIITHARAHTRTHTYLLSSSRVITYSSFPTPRASSSSSATRATLSR